MMSVKQMSIATIVLVAFALPAAGQSTSISKKHDRVIDDPSREVPETKGNPTIENSSLIAVKESEPRKFKVQDLITIIVRVQTQYEADGTANARRQSSLSSQLDALEAKSDTTREEVARLGRAVLSPNMQREVHYL